jgi:thiamine biosynthesis lipoprotein
MIRYTFPLFLLLSLLISACQPRYSPTIELRQDGVTAFSGQAMTMLYTVLIGQPLTPAQTSQITTILDQTFRDTDTIYNKWNPNSELSRLNQQKAGITTPLSPLLQRLFQEADTVVRLSQGKFDPTIEPLQHLWKEKLTQGTLPNQQEIAAITPAIGWKHIAFTHGLFQKDHDLTQLDFGGIAKGLCIDLMVERLNAAGFPHVFVEWGGEIRATGNHPEGRSWTIYISRLGDSNPEHAIATLHLDNQAVATSGDYLQNWTIMADPDENKQSITYFHIFDPETLHPLEATPHSVASTSVIAPNCALADGLATIALLFASPEEATAWAEKVKEEFPDLSFWIVSRNRDHAIIKEVSNK